MNRRLVGPAVAAAAAGAVLVAGIGTAQAATPHRAGLTVKLSKDGVNLPSHLRPGRVDVKVQGDSDAFFVVFRARHDAGPKRLVADLKALDKADNPSKLDADFAFVASGIPGSNLSFTLKTGKYYAMNADVEKASAVTTVKVSGATTNATKPKVAGTVTAIHSRSWADNKLNIAHKGWVRFDNDSTRTHFLLAFQLEPGVTIAQVKKDLSKSGNGGSDDFTGVDGMATVLAPGHHEDVSYSLPKGNYALLSYWSDSHGDVDASLGMIRGMTLH